MNNLKKAIAILSVAALAVGAIAQGGAAGGPPGGNRPGQGQGGMRMRMMGGMANPSMLLMRADVQDDLKLTNEQKDSLQALQEKMQSEARNRFMGGGERPSREEMSKMMRESMAKLAVEVDKILTPEQRTRLQQIYIQTSGVRSVTDANVAKALGITADQKAKIDNMVRGEQEANGELFRNRDLSQEDRMAKVEKNNKALEAGITQVLTPAQKTKLKEMEGPKFTATEEPGRPARVG